ncbi:MAG: hypothetical protein JNM93_10995 [Bacteriovoracaceae bacterium]|nr:hypothetical protein [Bacteriovoracaceae bacterium]
MKFIILLSILFSSCSIAVKTPSSRFISPEAKGEFLHTDLGMSYGGYSKGELEPTGAGPVTDPLVMKHSQGVMANGTLGFTEQVDIYVVLPERTTPQVGFKFQLLGKSEKEATKKNHSLATTIAYGRAKTTDADFLTSSNDKADITNRVLDFSVIYGYRAEENLLLYTGVSYSDYDFDGKFTSGANSGRIFQYDSKTLGCHAGLMTSNKKWFTKLEASLQQTDWTHTGKQAYGFGAIQVGYNWN